MNSNDIVDLSYDSPDEDCQIIDYQEPVMVDISYDELYKECPLMAQFFEMCLDVENTPGMIRVLYKSLLKSFRMATDEYKKSSYFLRALVNTSKLLEMDPIHKFSHIKSLSDELRASRVKKRARIITLCSDLKDRKMRKQLKKKKITADNEETVIETIVIGEDKENKSESREQNTMNEIESVCEIVKVQEDAASENNLLVPHRVVNEDQMIEETIKFNEDKIAYLKNIIDRLEEEEVDDNDNSPYLKCERLKNEVVICYKKLCKLTGAEPVRRREIRLRREDGENEASVVALEEYLNNNIGDDGYPPFPGFDDVYKCVVLANQQHDLSWPDLKMAAEAKALFVHCGRALQKLRQEREWNDLMYLVKEELHDPADNDPELLAKLEQNRRLGNQNEAAVLERFTKLAEAKRSTATKEVKVSGTLCNNDTEEEDSETDDLFVSINVNKNTKSVNTFSTGIESNKNSQLLKDKRQSEISADNNQSETTTSKNQSEALIDKRQSEVTTDKNQSEALTDKSQNEVKTGKSGSDVKVKTEIKLEPYDIAQVLESLGDNFTTTILDIEDPFLVVEISSDSDDDDVTML